MPGYDRTGPNGLGPLTGRGMGDCNAAGRGLFRNSRGMGRSMGRGMGQRAQSQINLENEPGYDNSQSDELKNEIQDMQSQISELKEMILSLKTNSSKTEDNTPKE